MHTRLTMLRSAAASVVLAAACTIGATAAGATTIGFDDAPVGNMPAGYGGLSWQFWEIVEPDGSGNHALQHGGFGEPGVTHPVESAPNSCCVPALFDFFGAGFARGHFGQDSLHEAGSVLLRGWLNGNPVYSIEAPLNEAGYTNVIVNFLGIDGLEVHAIPASAFGIGYPGFYMDNFSYRLAEDAAADAAAVPEPATLVLFGTGAVVTALERARRRRRQV